MTSHGTRILGHARTAGGIALSLIMLWTAPVGAQPHSTSSSLITERIEIVSRLLEKHRLLGNVEDTTDAILRAWLENTDPLAAYWTPEEARDAMAAECGQIYEAGLQLAVSNGIIEVIGVSPDTNYPNIKLGDRLVAVDHAPVTGESVERIASWLQLKAHRPIILTLADESDVQRTVSVPVRAAQKPAVAVAETLPTGLAYLKLNGFYADSDSEILSTIRRWVGQSDIYGLILDIRQAGGRDASAAAAAAAMLATEGRLLATFRDTTDNRELAAFRAQPSFKADLPVMVLTDENTRGAAEWFAAVVKGLGRGAMLVGMETRGDPLVRETVNLPWQRVLYMVTRQLVVADGTYYTGREKVVPHIIVQPSTEAPYEPSLTPDAFSKMTPMEREDRKLRLRVGNDATLRRAVELLQGLRALNVGIRSSP